jgi:hypothetical protein
MRIRIAMTLWVGLLAVTGTVVAAAPLAHEQKAELIKDLSEGLNEIYVFPEVAEQMVKLINDNLEQGEYAGLDSLPAFTQRLTEDLQSISHDLHLRVRPTDPPPPTDPNADDADHDDGASDDARFNNFGFHKLERLPGNIGYLDLRGFSDAGGAGPTAVAAMNFLANSSALIIDLRQNGGGSPSMIQLISSYFFAEPQHLNTFYIRQTDSHKQFWTHANVDGPKMVDTPIYVLTSGRTFSAAEEFTYNLKNMERATIVGETTGGGAHPVTGMVSDMGGGHYAFASIPFGRAINPITKTNWEGTGVTPHIQVPAAQALRAAQVEILESLAAAEENPDRKFGFKWALEGLRAQLDATMLSSDMAAAYVGRYGPRSVSFEDGRLLYQREDGPRYELLAMGNDRFRIEEIDYFRVQFGRDDASRVVELTGLYADGRTAGNHRDN